MPASSSTGSFESFSLFSRFLMIVCLLPGGREGCGGGEFSFFCCLFLPLSIPNNNQAWAGGGMSSLDLLVCWAVCSERGRVCMGRGSACTLGPPTHTCIKDAATASWSPTPERIPTAVHAVLRAKRRTLELPGGTSPPATSPAAQQPGETPSVLLFCPHRLFSLSLSFFFF